MYTILVITHVLVSVALIAIVLVQHGKGADAGAAFGSGASGTVFGSRGSANFLTRVTAWLAGSFFVLSLALAYIVNGRSGVSGSVVDALPAAAPSAVVVPAAPETPAAGLPANGEPQVPVAEVPKPEPSATGTGESPKPKVPE